MISPHPESDLSLNELVLGAEIVSQLKKKKAYVLIEDMMRFFLKKDPKRTPDLFFDVLVLLYAFDFIKIMGYKIRLRIS